MMESNELAAVGMMVFVMLIMISSVIYVEIQERREAKRAKEQTKAE